LPAFPPDPLAADLKEERHGAVPGSVLVAGVFAAPGSSRTKLSELLPEFGSVTGTGRDEEWGDDFLPAGMSAASVTRLDGGEVNSTWLVVLTDGQRVVVKGGRTAPGGLFADEAAGLAVLRTAGRLRTPRVLSIGATFLVLEALNPDIPDVPGFWDAAARAVAGLHAHVSPRYGWDHDGWLGWLPQENAWEEDGHRFFAERRILRYLREPAAQRALDASDRAGLERLCARLPVLLPASPAVLTHGDLWRGNMVADPAERPVFIDPAVSWTWAEVDLSMMYCNGGAPARFFDAYHELNPPLSGGWRERMELLHLRELLAVVAHFGPTRDCLGRIRDVITRFA
jgi:fructosamine-3-kinase